VDDEWSSVVGEFGPIEIDHLFRKRKIAGTDIEERRNIGVTKEVEWILQAPNYSL
jgi:hypothetical protein